MTFEPALLPESVKEQLCRQLLEEFGAVSIRHRPSQAELTHACLINPDMHGDQRRNPTASLNYEKLTYKCLGCQAKGGILWFIARVRRCSAKEARDWLAKEVGTDGTVMPLQKLLEYYDALYADSRRPPPIPTYHPSVLEPWKGVHPWVTGERQIPMENAKDLHIGYDLDDDSVVIPHFWKGDLVGWQKRRLSGSGPKYTSTEEMPKDQTLYDYDPKRPTAVIVESPMSVARHRHALPMEATFGANVTDRQVKLIARHSKQVILWMDNDKAGWQALRGLSGAPGLIERLMPYCPVRVVQSPLAGDPADVTTRVALALVKSAVPACVWRPPGTLACPQCLSDAHSGLCDPVG